MTATQARLNVSEVFLSVIRDLPPACPARRFMYEVFDAWHKETGRRLGIGMFRPIDKG